MVGQPAAQAEEKRDSYLVRSSPVCAGFSAWQHSSFHGSCNLAVLCCCCLRSNPATTPHPLPSHVRPLFFRACARAAEREERSQAVSGGGGSSAAATSGGEPVPAGAVSKRGGKAVGMQPSGKREGSKRAPRGAVGRGKESREEEAPGPARKRGAVAAEISAPRGSAESKRVLRSDAQSQRGAE